MHATAQAETSRFAALDHTPGRPSPWGTRVAADERGRAAHAPARHRTRTCSKDPRTIPDRLSLSCTVMTWGPSRGSATDRRCLPWYGEKRGNGSRYVPRSVTAAFLSAPR